MAEPFTYILSACNYLPRQYKLPKVSDKINTFVLLLDQLLPEDTTG